jgi:type VI secretion system protein ImpL
MLGGGAIGGAAMLAYVLRRALGWGWTTTLLIFIAELVIASIAYLAVSFWQRRGKRQSTLAGTDTTTFVASPPSETDPRRVQQMTDRWKAGLKTLNESQLKETGDPLYAMPWYITLGRPGSGKSMAARNCGVPMPLTTLPDLSELPPTENLKWWFLDTAVILDVTGRYCFPGDDAAARQEWRTLVTMLTDTRHTETLNGVIVAVSVEDLKTRDLESLRDDAKRIRHRVNVLASASNMDFPVYIMVTKTDRIQGFAPFFEKLPAKGRDQILGALNPAQTDGGRAVDFFQTAYLELIDRLRRLRLSVFLDAEENESGRIHLLPEELDHLAEPLSIFIETLFAQNPYENTPFFRGFLLTSAVQSQTPYSHFLKMAGAEDVVEPQEEGRVSYFLHDFFAQVLKRDRRFAGLSEAAREWWRNTKIAGLIGWSALWLLAVILLTLSWNQNRAVMNIITPEAKLTQAQGAPVTEGIDRLNKVYHSVQAVYEQNRAGSLPRLGLDQSFTAETEVRRQYVIGFKNNVLDPLDQAVRAELDEMLANLKKPAAPVEEPEGLADWRGIREVGAPLADWAKKPVRPVEDPSGRYRPLDLAPFIHLALDRVSLLAYCLKAGEDRRPAEHQPQPDYAFWLRNAAPEADDEKIERLRTEYTAYLRLQVDEGLLQKELEAQTEIVNQLIAHDRIGLDWIVAEVNGANPDLTITLSPFWFDNDLSSVAGADVAVAPAFTRQGWESRVKPLVDRISARVSGDVFDQRKARFEKDYWNQYLRQWAAFLDRFPSGARLWDRLINRLEAAPKVLGDQSPYFQVLAAAGRQIEPAANHAADGLPPWAALIRQYHRFHLPAYQKAYQEWAEGREDVAGSPSFFDRVQIDPGPAAAQKGAAFQATEQDVQTIALFVDFESQLAQMADTLADKNQTFEIVRQTFEEQRPTSAAASPALKAQWDLGRAKNVMGEGRPDEDTFWNLFEALLAFGWRTELDVTAFMLQNEWEKEVLAEVTDLTGWKRMNALLYGRDAKVWTFVDDQAAPFLKKEKTGGYAAKEIIGQTVPFSQAFLNMLEGGKRSGQQLAGTADGALTVRLEAMPTDVNNGAKTGIIRTVVKLYCGKEVQMLENLNFPVGQTFEWKPNVCQDVVLEFDTGEASVEKEYTGFTAFADFIADVADGQQTYPVSDLIKSRGDVTEDNVTSVTIRFKKPRGHEPLLKFLEHSPDDVPERIVTDRAL